MVITIRSFYYGLTIFLSEVAKIKIEKENFEYLISSEIVVMGDYKNEDYYDRVKNKKDEINSIFPPPTESVPKILKQKNLPRYPNFLLNCIPSM